MDVTTTEYRDLSSCTSMSLNVTGRFALLGGRRFMGLVSLDKPHEVLQKVKRVAKYDVQEIQFSFGCENLAAVACNDKIELWNWRPGGDMACQKVLKKHTRAVTDLSFHGQETNLLATSSFDNFMYIWDLKDARRPAIELPTVSGATQACWERMSGRNLATAHEGEIKIWDIRKASIPQQYITAHPSKIFALDFSPVRENQLVSSSADNTVKMWDVSSAPRQPENIIRVPGGHPVWKVRYTPFGEGLVTLIYYTVVRRENNLMLWSAQAQNNTAAPVHTFYGHMDMVLEFAWRNVDPSQQRYEYQLVTWGKDSMMKLWPIGGHLKVMCGEEEDTDMDQILDDEKDKQNGNGTNGHSNSMVIKRLSSVNEMGNNSQTMETPRSSVSSESVAEYSFNMDLENSSVEVSTPNKNNAGQTIIQRVNSVEGLLRKPASGSQSEEVDQQLACSVPTMGHRLSTLKKEFATISFGDRLVLDTLDFVEMYCVIRAETTKHMVLLDVRLPTNYPNCPPLFTLMTGTTLDQTTGFRLLRRLRNTAQSQVSKNKVCLQVCLRQFEQEIEQIVQEEQTELLAKEQQQCKSLGNWHDSNIPYPRTSGARFCGMGQLVCFGWTFTVMLPSSDIVPNAPKTMKTPRALSAVSGNAAASATPSKLNKTMPAGGATPPGQKLYGQSVPANSPSLYMKNRGTARHLSSGGVAPGKISSSKRMNSVGSNMSESDSGLQIQEVPRAIVTIYDALPLVPFVNDLALQYKIRGPSVGYVCRHNALVALDNGYQEVAKIWAMAAKYSQIVSKQEQDMLAKLKEKVGSSHQCKLKQKLLQCSCPRDSQMPSSMMTSLSLKPSANEEAAPWSIHPFGRNFLNQIIAHCAKDDLQTVAMLCCVFAQPNFTKKETQNDNKCIGGGGGGAGMLSKNWHSFPHKPPHSNIKGKKNSKSECSSTDEADPSISEVAEAYSASVRNSHLLPPEIKGYRRARSNSETPSVGGFASRFSQWYLRTTTAVSGSEGDNNTSCGGSGAEDDVTDESGDVIDCKPSDVTITVPHKRDASGEKHETNSALYLDPKDAEYHDSFRSTYADLLARMGHLNKSVEVSKRLTSMADQNSLIFTLAVSCPECDKPISGSYCTHCSAAKAKKARSKVNAGALAGAPTGTLPHNSHCALCQQRVRGLASICLACGHGGHTEHIKAWFGGRGNGRDQCPTGCGCPCPAKMAEVC